MGLMCCDIPVLCPRLLLPDVIFLTMPIEFDPTVMNGNSYRDEYVYQTGWFTGWSEGFYFEFSPCTIFY